MFGFINVSKPSGKTSRQVVDRVVRCAAGVKAGHAGTLDPLASGVLVVAVGPATRLIQYVQQMPKRYEAVFLLGHDSPTEDIEGEVVQTADNVVPTRAALDRGARQLVGPILQRPPAYSALKVAGRRAYELARRGESFVLAPRPVTIHRLEITHYEYPEMRLAIECSAGTYVRSLGRDLAQCAGTLAVMSALVRTAVGRFTLEEATEHERITAQRLDGLIRDPLVAFDGWPRLVLEEAEIARVSRGQTFSRPQTTDLIPATTRSHESREAVAVDATGKLLALLKCAPMDQNSGRDVWHPHLTFFAGH